jgi:hypothetical protein
LGIGTSSPSELLHINRASGTGAYIRIQDDTGGNYIGTDGGVLQFFDGSASEKMRIDASGNVGIGTTSPFFTTSGRTSLSVNGSTSSILAFGKGGSSENYILADAGGLTIANTSTTLPTIFFNNGAERLRITSSGNVGIGTSSPSEKLTIAGDLQIGESSGGEKLKFVGASGKYNFLIGKQVNVDNALEITPSTATGGNTFSTPAVVVNSSGNVGIGTSSPSATLALDKNTTTQHRVLDLENNSITYSMYLDQDNSSTNSWSLFDTTNLQTALRYLPSSSGYWQFYTNNAERMRIDSSGNLLVGTTSGFGGLINAPVTTSDEAMVTQSNSTSASTHLNFRNPNGFVGSISTSASATAFNTSSDQRLKENIADADDAGSKIDAIQVRKFDWITDGSHQDYGMVAQELVTVAPEAVSAPEDPDEMMGVDYSKLVPMLIKEIQSLRARVQQLENN